MIPTPSENYPLKPAAGPWWIDVENAPKAEDLFIAVYWRPSSRLEKCLIDMDGAPIRWPEIQYRVARLHYSGTWHLEDGICLGEDGFELLPVAFAKINHIIENNDATAP